MSQPSQPTQLVESPPEAYPRRTDGAEARLPLDGDTKKLLKEARMTLSASLSRKLAARAPFIASLLGMVISMSSVVFFFVEDDFRRILGVTAGLFFLLLAIWYAAHPFFREERVYLELRREVDEFIDLTRQLHYAAIQGDDAAFESIEERIPAQVEIVIDAARRSEPLRPRESSGVSRPHAVSESTFG